MTVLVNLGKRDEAREFLDQFMDHRDLITWVDTEEAMQRIQKEYGRLDTLPAN